MKNIFLAIGMAATTVLGTASISSAQNALTCSAECNKAYWQCVRNDDGEKMSSRVRGCAAESNMCNKVCWQK